MSESNLVVLPDMQATKNTEAEEVKAQEGVVSAASKKLDEEEKGVRRQRPRKDDFPPCGKDPAGIHRGG